MAERLTDAEVERRLEELNELLEALEAMPGQEGAVARDAVSVLAEIYGEALGRLLAAAFPDRRDVDRLSGDRLVSHLLILHGLGPPPAEPSPDAFIPVAAVRVKARS